MKKDDSIVLFVFSGGREIVMSESGGADLGVSVPPTGTPVSSEVRLGREELVGKRFLLVQGPGAKPKINRVADWSWKAGVIRCASHSDQTDQDLQVRQPSFDSVPRYF